MVELIDSISASAAAIYRSNVSVTRRLSVWSFCCWALLAGAASGDCPAPPESAALQRVERVIDGDTLVLVGGDRVRILGINTFEPRDPGLAGMYSKKATAAVRTWLAHSPSVAVSPVPYRRDRHGRVLAHLWIDGQHLGESLLREGLGLAVAIPPLVDHAPCLFAAEQSARNASRGIWSSSFVPIAASDVTTGGFQVVRGQITAVRQRTVWLGAQFAVTLPRGLTVERGQEIEVRGWVRSPKASDQPPIFRLPLEHPANLTVRLLPN